MSIRPNCIDADLPSQYTCCPDPSRTATRRQSHSSEKNVSRWQLLQSVTQIALKIHFVARRSCARVGMVRHGSIHIQNVQRNTFLCETFVRSDGMVRHGSIHIQNVQRNTFLCETFVRSDGMVRHGSLHMQGVQRNTACCETVVR